jgi:hypothetical protein
LSISVTRTEVDDSAQPSRAIAERIAKEKAEILFIVYVPLRIVKKYNTIVYIFQYISNKKLTFIFSPMPAKVVSIYMDMTEPSIWQSHEVRLQWWSVLAVNA